MQAREGERESHFEFKHWEKLTLWHLPWWVIQKSACLKSIWPTLLSHLYSNLHCCCSPKMRAEKEREKDCAQPSTAENETEAAEWSTSLLINSACFSHAADQARRRWMGVGDGGEKGKKTETEGSLPIAPDIWKNSPSSELIQLESLGSLEFPVCRDAYARIVRADADRQGSLEKQMANQMGQSAVKYTIEEGTPKQPRDKKQVRDREPQECWFPYVTLGESSRGLHSFEFKLNLKINRMATGPVWGVPALFSCW